MIAGILICGISIGAVFAVATLFMGGTLLWAVVAYTSGGILGISIGACSLLRIKCHNN